MTAALASAVELLGAPIGDVDGTVAMLGVLAVLALIDSTSFGTLLIPVWLMSVPGRVAIGRILTYLGVVAGLYLLIGVAIMLGADAALGRYGHVLESRPFLVAQLLVGVALFAVSFRFDSKRARARAAELAATGGGRVQRWRTRAVGGDGDQRSTSTLMGLALTAVVLEVATMLPYLAGIGIITTQGPPWPSSAWLLLGYCLVMVAPALVLLLGRVVASSVLTRPLARLDGWLTANAASTTGWIVGIVGFLVATNAIGELGLIGT